MGSKYELFYGEVHPVVKDAELYLQTISDEDMARIEERLRQGIRDDDRKCVLLWLPFGRIKDGNPIAETDLMFISWFIRDFLKGIN